jgi:hypothetical protein
MPYCRSHVAYPGAAGGRWTARDRARARGEGSVASAVNRTRPVHHGE